MRAMASLPAASLRALVVGALAVVALLALIEPAVAADDPPDQIVVSGAVVIPRGLDVGELVVLHGSARVDGVAHGDVVVVDGPVAIRGQVSGDVIAVDGRVVVGPGAQVNGDVSARGSVILGEGARVAGRVRQHVAYGWRTPVAVVGRFASWLAVSMSTLLLGLLLVLLAPRALDATAGVARSSPWRAAGWAVVLAIGVPVTVLLALASLVALPLGLAALLAVALFAFVGYAISAYAIGRAIRPAPGTRALAFAIGWLIVRAVAAIPVVSGITFALAAAYGLGLAAVAMWRARATAGRHRGTRRAGPETSPVVVAERPSQTPEVAPLGEQAGL
jgi:hypothetical protein